MLYKLNKTIFLLGIITCFSYLSDASACNPALNDTPQGNISEPNTGTSEEPAPESSTANDE